jgi:hypothetical protein
MFHSLENFPVGTVVTARLFGGVMTQGTVEGHGEKNGMDLLDLDNGHWCYVHQVMSIVKRPATVA